MQYTIKRLNRSVNLNDDLANEYLKYDDIRDYSFSIAARNRYGDKINEVSDGELSALCNEVLLGDLKALALLPKALSYVEQMGIDSKNEECKEYALQ